MRTREALAAFALIATIAAACLPVFHFKQPVETVDFEDASWGGGYVEHVGGAWRLVVPLAGGEARAALRSRREFYGGYFEVEMKTTSSRVGGSAFYLYGEGGGEFWEIDVEVYGFMEDPGDAYANLNPATVDFTCWAKGQRNLMRVGLGFMANEAFHKYAVRWVPGEVAEFYVDGVKAGAFYGDKVPDKPMRFYLQTWYADWMKEFGAPEGNAVTLFRNVKVGGV